MTYIESYDSRKVLPVFQELPEGFKFDPTVPPKKQQIYIIFSGRTLDM